MDKKLLYEVMQMQSSYNEDSAMMNFIEKKLSMNEGVTITKDSFGNIYAKKGSGKNGYKCIVSHTDTVHKIKKDFYIAKINDVLFAMGTESTGESDISQTGIGGDDKCGIYTCLQSMIDFDDIKSVFFRFEESGCNGSRNADMDFFNDCNFVLQCDRRGHSDFITSVNGVKIASKEFESEMEPLYKKYGFKLERGLSTDVGALKNKGLLVSACNMSSGYHDPHTDKETVNVAQLMNTYSLVTDIFNTHGERKFPHEKEIVSYTPKRSYKSERWYSPLNITNKKFTASINSNFFTSSSILSNDDIIEIEDIEYNTPLFSQIANSGMYKYMGDNYLDLEHERCPKCNNKSLIFSVRDSAVYCSSSICKGSPINDSMDKHLYKNCVIEDCGRLFVYDNINNVWLDDLDSSWDSKLNSYVSLLKEF